jgi:hypothetical protein
LAKNPKDLFDDAEYSRRHLLALLKSNRCELAMEISPTMAAIMLERNTGNRPKSASRIRGLAEAMKAGDWHVTGEPIVFSVDGVLNDGQHRLSACMASGVTIRSDVRFGVEREAFAFTGIGAKRTGADALSIKGEKHATTIAGSIRLLNCYDKQDYSFIGAVTPAETIAILNANPRLRESAEKSKEVYGQFRLIQPSPGAFCHYVCARLDGSLADKMFDAIAFGNIPNDEPVGMLRKLLINQGTKRSIVMPESAALIFKTWNMLRDGKAQKTLRWRTEGTCPESFPIAK